MVLLSGSVVGPGLLRGSVTPCVVLCCEELKLAATASCAVAVGGVRYYCSLGFGTKIPCACMASAPIISELHFVLTNQDIKISFCYVSRHDVHLNAYQGALS